MPSAIGHGRTENNTPGAHRLLATIDQGGIGIAQYLLLSACIDDALAGPRARQDRLDASAVDGSRYRQPAGIQQLDRIGIHLRRVALARQVFPSAIHHAVVGACTYGSVQHAADDVQAGTDAA